MAACVIARGATVHRGAVGVRKHGDPQAVTVEDRFHLGSCTKAMTAVLVAMMIEEGKARWDSRLDEMLPDTPSMHADLRAVTLDHLLAHRSGLSPTLHPRPASLAALVEARRSTAASRQARAQFVAGALAAKPAAAPGAQYLYCNAGYIVLGAIVERLTDTPWEDLMRQRLFGPLGMATAGFGAMGEPGKVDQPWQHRDQAGKRTPIGPGPLSDNPPELGPAGTAHSSVGDWARFIAAVLDGAANRAKLLKRATWRRLLTPQFGGNYAGGWLTTKRDWGGHVLNHAGSNTMSFCVAWLAPERRYAVAVMANLGGDTAARACDEAAGALIGRFPPA
jgi:CubicO group peptidase (beta-lactamase class C family)